jgi:hypothetical protein
MVFGFLSMPLQTKFNMGFVYKVSCGVFELPSTETPKNTIKQKQIEENTHIRFFVDLVVKSLRQGFFL